MQIIKKATLTTILMLCAYSSFFNTRAIAQVFMNHQANSFHGLDHDQPIYIYRNILSWKNDTFSPLHLLLANVFDYEYQNNSYTMNRPMFGGGQTDAIFAGVKLSATKHFSITAQNVSVWFYNQQGKFMDFVYIDPVLQYSINIRGGSIYFQGRLRNALGLEPSFFYDLREMVEVGFMLLQKKLKAYIGNELNINQWPLGNFRQNDLFAGMEYKLAENMTGFVTMNWQNSRSQDYLNSFLGIRYRHKLP